MTVPDGSWGLPTGSVAVLESPAMGLFFLLGGFL